MTEAKGASPQNPIDNSADWVAAHIKGFDEPDGSGWPTLRGAPLLLLTTKGAKSGLWRRTALIYGEDADRFVIVASKGGAPADPAWFENLIAHPEVHVQVRDRKFRADASIASSAQKQKLWDEMVSIWPAYADYRVKTDRDIPIVILTPLD